MFDVYIYLHGCKTSILFAMALKAMGISDRGM